MPHSLSLRRTRRVPSVALALLALLTLVPTAALAQPGAPSGPIPPSVLAARRAAVVQAMLRTGRGVMILRAAEERDPDGRDHAQDNWFRQDNDLFYLTGLETPNAYLVLVTDSAGARETFFLPPRDTLAERWMGPRLGPGAEVAQLTGIADVRAATATLDAELRALAFGRDSLPRAGTVWMKRGRTEQLDPVLAALRAAAAPPAAQTANASTILDALRLVKDADEIARMRKASEISAAGHLATWRIARPGISERELEAEAEATFRRLGSERIGYPSIVGAGRNGTILHYDASRGTAQAGDLVVMDMGTEWGYYKADITRTIPVDGRFTPRQRAIYDLVYGAQQAAIDSLKPGMTIAQLNGVARRWVRAHSGTLCGAAPCDRYFPHGLSHWLGLDTHDVGDYQTPLAPGMVLTIEPGIYLPEERFGVRIEDVVLVTERGAELLSAGAPRRAEDVERYMREQGARGRRVTP